jgi:hypothetical protein
MNERIQKLLTPKLKEWGGGSGDNFSEELEAFAELIVLKCAEIADTAEPFLASDLIKQHFGVE